MGFMFWNYISFFIVMRGIVVNKLFGNDIDFCMLLFFYFFNDYIVYEVK